MKILVSGGGSIGRRHIANLRVLGYTELYCLRRSYDEAFDKENQVTTVLSYEEATRVGCKVIFVCSPTSRHLDDLKYAVDNDMHIFMEKPLIHTAEGVKLIQQQTGSYKKIFFIGFMLRFHPLVIKLKELLDAKVLGEVYSARFEFGSYLPYWHPWEDHRISYASRKELGGGVINTITHELDLIQYFFGAPDALSCLARNFKKLDIEVEEVADAVFEYEDKIVTLHLDYLQKDYDRQIKVLGDLGKIYWNWHDNKLVLQIHKEEKKEFALPEFNVNQLYIDELKHFFTLIQENKQKHSLDLEHAIQNAELTFKMHESKGNKVIVHK